MHLIRSMLLGVVLSASATAAFALQPQSWVSGSGSGLDCTFASPCARLVSAVAATSPGGVVSVLNSGDFFQDTQFSITKSITIRAVGTDGGGTSTIYAGQFITINVGASNVVVIDGFRFVGPGLNIEGSGKVFIRNCTFSSNTLPLGNPPNPVFNFGVRIQPSGALKVAISDSTAENNGISSGGGGFIITPQTGGTAQVMLERVTAQGNTFGVAVDGSQSTGGINVTIADSVLSANTNDGLVATSSPGKAPIGVMVTNSKLTNNGFGVRSIGSNVTVRVDGSRIAGNGTGVSVLSGGSLLSAGNNIVQANGADGSFTGAVPFQ